MCFSAGTWVLSDPTPFSSPAKKSGKEHLYVRQIGAGLTVAFSATSSTLFGIVE
jgi:hypothetical protein